MTTVTGISRQPPDWGGSADNPDQPFLGDPNGISAFADQERDAAHNFLLTLASAATSLIAPTIDPEFPQGPEAPGQLTPTLPTFQTVVWTNPNAPPDFTEDLEVDDILPEAFDEDAPTLVFPTAPAEFTEAAPDAPPIDFSYEEPELEVNLPDAPDLLSLNIVPFDGMDLPTIDPDAVPELTIVEPSIREYIPGEEYTSNLLTSLRAYLQDVIDNGGTGLDEDVENAIWDRGREREARAARDAIDKLEEMEAMGFMLPPGVYTDARLRVITETDYAERGLSREIMIKQAELAYAATKDAIAGAYQVEAKLIDQANNVEQRLFDSCKYATEAGIAIYNAKVQGYVAYLDAYKTKIQIYEAQVRAEIAKVEAYKATVEAERAKAEVNIALVNAYEARIRAALSAVDIYKARIEGIRVKADIEKTKIDVFGEQVRAYAARINAYTAGVEGFRARIAAEGTKQEVFRSQVEAYRAQVEAASSAVNVRIQAFRGRLDANIARWDGYKSAIQGETAKVQSLVAYNSGLADIFKAEVAGITSYNETLTKQWQVALEQAQRTAEIGVSAAKANAEMYVTTRSLALDAAKVGAQVSAQLGAAALNAINWSHSISNSSSFGVSSGWSMSYSQSKSDSENTNYNYSV